MDRTFASPSPLRWAVALALSLVLAPLGPMVLSYRPLPLPWLLLGITCLVYTAALFGMTKFLLVRSLRNSEWPDASLEQLRSILQKPFWSCLVWSAILSQFVLLVAHPPHLFPAGPSWTVFPILALGELKRTVLPPPSEPQHMTLTLNNLRPIHSDHWGER